MTSRTSDALEFFLHELASPEPVVTTTTPSTDTGDEAGDASRPWMSADPRIRVLFQARLPDPLHKKLQWVSQHTVGGVSIHELLLTGTERYLDQRIAEIEQELCKNR